jgi:hypothetical protein
MSTSEPSVKGTLVQPWRDHLLGLVSAGRMTRQALEARLPEPSRKLLDARFFSSAWYSYEAYAELVEACCFFEHGGARHGYRKLGHLGMDQLESVGVYQQLQSWARGAGLSDREIASRLETLMSLPGLLYNFSKWSLELEVENGEYRQCLEVREAAPMRDWFREILEGTLESLWERLRMPLLQCKGDRPSRDRFVVNAVAARRKA